jgi:hypothetical protein
MLMSGEVGVLAQLFNSGPFAWNGLFTFWIPLTVFVAWFFVIAYTMLRAISAQEQSMAAVTASAAAQ